MKITIIGCGWLGLPLAERLKQDGHTVFGSTTRIEKLKVLEAYAINPFVFDGDNCKVIPVEAQTSEILILNFPPGRSGAYAEKIRSILEQMTTETKVFFTSSTGVYEDVEGDVDENGSLKIDHPVFMAEQAVRLSGKAYSILRLAGLIGGERHPVNFMSGRTIEDGNMVVNLIHREDVIAGIRKIILENKWNTVYNLVYPEHPTKSDYYKGAAKNRGIPEPCFEFSVKHGKCVSGKKISDELGFVYTHPI